MKISLWWWLALALAVLGIFYLYTIYSNQEPFILFGSESASGSAVIIPPYKTSSDVFKVYDTIYFDTRNANLLELDGVIKINDAGPDSSGNITTDSGNVSVNDSLKTIYTTKRDNSMTETISVKDFNNNPETSTIAGITAVLPSYTTWIYTSKTIRSDATRYQVIYTPIERTTFMHVLQLDSATNGINIVQSAAHDPKMVTSSNGPMLATFKCTGNIINNVAGTAPNDTSPANGGMTNLADYGNISVYQIKTNLWYDVRNGNLIYRDPQQNLVVYNRNGNSSSNIGQTSNTTTIANITTPLAWAVTDGYQSVIIYTALYAYSSILVLQKNAGQGWTVQYSPTFDATGPVIAPQLKTPQVITPSNDIDTAHSNYFGNGNVLYVLQMVPGACHCGRMGGACTCNGGSGGNPKAIGNSPAAPAPAPPANTAGGVSNNVVNTTGNTVNNVVNKTSDIVTGAGSGTKDLLEDTGSGIKNTGKDLVTGTWGALKEIASGVKSTTGDIWGEAKALGGNAISEVKGDVKGVWSEARELGGDARRGIGNGLDRLDERLQRDSQIRNQGVAGAKYGLAPATYSGTDYAIASAGDNQIIDPYSYNRTMKTRGESGNPMPITTNFSSFTR